MGERQHAWARARGGERIPALRPARPACIATAAAAFALVTALGAIVAGDAGRSIALAWSGAGLTALLLASGIAARSTAPAHCGVAVLGSILLLRHSDRLLLAPLYGGALLLIAELAVGSIELRRVSVVDLRSIGTRLGAVAAVAAVGVCGSACAAIAATGAPPRSLLLAAAGAITAGAVCAAIALAARRG